MPDVIVGVYLGVEVPHLQRGATGKAPFVRRALAILRAGECRRIDRPRTLDQLLELGIRAPEQHAAPRFPVGRDIASEVPKQEVRLAAAASAAKEQLVAPCRLYGRELRAGLRLPSVSHLR